MKLHTRLAVFIPTEAKAALPTYLHQPPQLRVAILMRVNKKAHLFMIPSLALSSVCQAHNGPHAFPLIGHTFDDFGFVGIKF